MKPILSTLLLSFLFFMNAQQMKAQSANNNCANAIQMISNGATVSSNTVTADTYEAATNAGCSPGNRDVWYYFTAVTTSHVVQITSSSSSRGRLEVFSGSCGAFTSLGNCNNSVTLSGLTPGNNYYVRIYSNNNSAISFSVRITHIPPPANDACANAINLNSNNSCNNTSGTLLNATSSALIWPSCGNGTSADVWYRYTATNAFPTISLSNLGSDLSSTGAAIQLFDNNCTSPTSLACVSGNTLNTFTAVGGNGLTIGETYLIRVYSNTGFQSGSNWGFNICITNYSAPGSPTIDFGKSYVNVTKGTNGGTIEPNDILEIRATFVVRSNIAFNARYQDLIPTNTSYVPGTLRILTNEGKIFRQWTDGLDSDPAQVTGSNVVINLGYKATASTGGYVRNSDKPSFYSSTCIMIASYRVQVGAVPYGSLIPLGGGSITYQNGPSTGTNTLNFPTVTGMVYRSTGICENTTGGNVVQAEFGGTFGSGLSKDRASSASVPNGYTFVNFNSNDPQDYRYGISNNTSANTGTGYSINPNETVSSRRVFTVWDITGDHTGAVNPLQGNLPANVNAGQSGGYMVVINAAYRTDAAFTDTIRGLCSNTSYEYSAWFRNMCRMCGCDSNGTGQSSAGYIPTGPGDSSGVRPTLTFNVNGIDYYSTGDIAYTGQWVKKGFTYRTGPNETEMIITIRNNAPGGGGNDWAIDDINVATCTPNLKILPGPNTNVCYGNQVDIYAEVKSFFDNYTFATWEKSVDGGLTWQPTGVVDNLNYVLVGGEYIDTTFFPPFLGDSAAHMNQYRVRVASSLANLSNPNCSFIATTTVVIYVNNCSEVLPTKIISVNGKLNQNMATVQWITSNESFGTQYDVERSESGGNFRNIGTLKARYGHGSGGAYELADPQMLTGATFYRIKMSEGSAIKYSRTIQLQPGKQALQVFNLANPFYDQLKFSLQVPQGGPTQIQVFDHVGRLMVKQQVNTMTGTNEITLPSTRTLSPGTYTVQIQAQQSVITQRVMKLDR